LNIFGSAESKGGGRKKDARGKLRGLLKQGGGDGESGRLAGTIAEEDLMVKKSATELS